MVQVQPIVQRQFALQHLIIVHFFVGNFGIHQGHCYRIVPWLLGRWGINGNFGGHFELHHVHIHLRIGYLQQNLLVAHIR